MPRTDLIEVRAGTAAEWAAADAAGRLLLPGEPGWDETNRRLVIGDGATDTTDLRAVGDVGEASVVTDVTRTLTTANADIGTLAIPGPPQASNVFLEIDLYLVVGLGAPALVAMNSVTVVLRVIDDLGAVVVAEWQARKVYVPGSPAANWSDNVQYRKSIPFVTPASPRTYHLQARFLAAQNGGASLGTGSVITFPSAGAQSMFGWSRRS